MALSVGFGVWSACWSHLYVVRAAQPFFLIQICVGTFIVALSIIPLSFQEDMPGLDQACTSLPWLISNGSCIAIAALYSKARRINELTNTGAKRKGGSFRKIEITPSDVIWPVFIMLHTSLGFLVAWTASPFKLVWIRTPLESYDALGRSISSFGACRPADQTNWYLLFLVPIYLVNMIMVGLATIVSYRGRTLPTEFSETKYLTVALVSLSETVVLGGKEIRCSDVMCRINSLTVVLRAFSGPNCCCHGRSHCILCGRYLDHLYWVLVNSPASIRAKMAPTACKGTNRTEGAKSI